MLLRLYSDTFMLYYIQNMGATGVNSYSVALPNAARIDIREYYTSCVGSSCELYNRAFNVLQEKGYLYSFSYIPYPNQGEFVQKQHFLAGWMGEQRPLTSVEISFLFFNLYRNFLGSALLTGFSQVAQSKEVRRYMVRGAEISKHHCKFLVNF